MVQRTRQMGVPVIADEQEAIVGFDVPRLQRMAARHRRAPGLGLKVTDAKDGPGAYVGGVREGSPGERAGLLVGDDGHAHLTRALDHVLGGLTIDGHVTYVELDIFFAKELLRLDAPGSSGRGVDGDARRVLSHES